MIFPGLPSTQDDLRAAISRDWLMDEAACLDRLLPLASCAAESRQRVESRAARLVRAVRSQRLVRGGVDALLHEYDLSSHEGVVLMCLAEALLRIPDRLTADRLIEDKLGQADWDRHLGHSRSLWVNASTWGLLLTGRLLRPEHHDTDDIGAFFSRLIARSGEAAVRLALVQAMRIIGRQFVIGRTIEEALQRSREAGADNDLYSFDMLGEAALGRQDAEAYFQAYGQAIEVLARHPRHPGQVLTNDSISVKLSALHPRYEFAQRARVLAELTPRLLVLAQQAMAAGISLTIDAEEAALLDLSLDLFQRLYCHESLRGWEGLGLAVQAYQKRALAVIDWLAALARKGGRRIPVRLVKGAYWDSEIKRAQLLGLTAYPVFTRKMATDVSYLACARRILAAGAYFYPQFASHNAHTVASVLEMVGKAQLVEFQRLYGMGEALYDELMGIVNRPIVCRVYAPVGSHEVLLPYLVRRLLENGANTSFVNRIADDAIPVARVIADPVEQIAALHTLPNPRIPLPRDLYGAARRNASGINLDDGASLRLLAEQLRVAASDAWQATPLVDGKALSGEAHPVSDPADRRRVIGTVVAADDEAIEQALASAMAAFPSWCRTPVETRATCLERAAEMLEAQRAELLALCIREGGRTLPDAVAELREAVDYCRYYAGLARAQCGQTQPLAGPVGERNELLLQGRGPFVCISPWNFPLAIFTGQVVAALVAGNTVVAKPAHQTPLMAACVTTLLHEAGVPPEVLHLLPGPGKTVGMRLVEDQRIAGVIFTGSTATAHTINRALARHSGRIPVLIAETGGLNCMIVDSSALPEQVVMDAVQSAFNSAGQRCSALRVLFLQEEIADRIIARLQGAMAELSVGDPALLATDIGPLIDEPARLALQHHVQRMRREACLLYEGKLPAATASGVFFAPHLFAIEDLKQLPGEVFGPVLHVIRYSSLDLDQVISAVNDSGYGLTLGIQSRVDATIRYIQSRVRVGNLYVNRNMIGATVGVQPFGGEGLSGTGPKAGGPHYLLRLMTERTCTVNTAALGGDPALLSLPTD